MAAFEATPAPKPGMHAVTPYLVVDGAAELITFMTAAFGAVERLRVPRGDGRIMHAELQLGDSALELADANDEYLPSQAALHLYLDDVDSAYRNAVARGATSLFAPTDQPYGERGAGVEDRWGNHWYLATHLEDVDSAEYARRVSSGWKGPAAQRNPGAPPYPAGYHTIVPTVRVPDAAGLLTFLGKAFGAVDEGERTLHADGTLLHAAVRLADSVLQVSEARGEWGVVNAHLHFFVTDVDAAYASAIAAGAAPRRQPADMEYGERSAGITDPYGNDWFLAKVIAPA